MTADEFRAWRARLGLTQATAAELLRVSKRAVEDWEQGTTPISHPVLLATRWLEEHEHPFTDLAADPGRPGGEDHIEVDVELDGKGGVARILDVREHVVLREGEVPAQTYGYPTPRLRNVRMTNPGQRYRFEYRLQQWWATDAGEVDAGSAGLRGEWRDVPVVDEGGQGR